MVKISQPKDRQPKGGTVRMSPAIANIFRQLFAIRQAIKSPERFKDRQAVQNRKDFLRSINESIDELVYLVAKDLGVEVSVVWGQLEDFAPGIQLPVKKKAEYFLK